MIPIEGSDRGQRWNFFDCDLSTFSDDMVYLVILDENGVWLGLGFDQVLSWARYDLVECEWILKNLYRKVFM